MTASPSASPHAPHSDTALVAGIVAGDMTAFESMMRQNNRRLFRVARSILRDDSEAEEAVQDGYVQAFRTLDRFRGEARLSTWLTRIVVNQALERSRRRKLPHAGPADEARLAEAAPDGVAETPETLAMRAELRRVVEVAIDGLDDAYRSVFMLRAVEGLSVAETADALGISEANAKVRYLRARNRLRSALGQRLGPLIESVFSFDGRRCDRLVTGVLSRLGLDAPACVAPATRVPTSSEGEHHDRPSPSL